MRRVINSTNVSLDGVVAIMDPARSRASTPADDRATTSMSHSSGLVAPCGATAIDRSGPRPRPQCFGRSSPGSAKRHGSQSAIAPALDPASPYALPHAESTDAQRGEC
jgi:hypothetical protein